MNRYYSNGFDRGWTIIGKTEKKIVDLLLETLPAHICLINSTWLGDVPVGLRADEHARAGEPETTIREFIDETQYTEVAVYSGPDWENRSESGIRADTHKLLEDKFENVYHIGNTNNRYYFNYWLEFIKDNWTHFNKDKYLSEPKLARSSTVGNNGKHFLCYNRKPHGHRVYLLNKIHDHGLQDYGIVSATQKSIETGLPGQGPGYTFPNPIVLKETHDESTLKIINEWGGQNQNDIISLGDAENWQRHFLTVVTESTVHTDLFISEKTLKPIIGLRPFIIYGDQNLYNKLKDWGFDVFEDMFPDILESLSQSDYKKRGDYIVDQLKILSGFNYVELEEKYKTLLPRLKANRARLGELIKENFNKISTLDEEFKDVEILYLHNNSDPDINYAVDDYKEAPEGAEEAPAKKDEIEHYKELEVVKKDYPPQPKKLTQIWALMTTQIRLRVSKFWQAWQVGQWQIGLPANSKVWQETASSRVPSESTWIPPFIVDKTVHDHNDIFYLWYDKLADDGEHGWPHPGSELWHGLQLPGNLSGRSLTVGDTSSIHWWYEFAELNYKIMDIEKFNEKVHGKKHPLHNYYFIEIAYLDGIAGIIRCIPDKVKELARKRMLQIVFVFPHEGFNIDTRWWMNMLTTAIGDNNLTEIYSYFIFGDINFTKNYEQWAAPARRNHGQFTKTFGYDYFQFLYRQQYILRTDPLQVEEFTLSLAEEFIKPDSTYERETLHTVPTAEVKTHDLLNFNGVPRPHRMAIVSELHRLGYKDRSHISFLSRHYDDPPILTKDLPTPAGKKEYSSRWDFQMQTVADSLLETKTQKDYLFKFFKKPREIKLDVTTEMLSQDDRAYDKKLYESSYFSLISETIFSTLSDVPWSNAGEEPQLFITEKTYKPLMNYHPFIVVGLPHTLAYLQSEGFYTFSEMFDETYDSIIDPEERFSSIINELKKWKSYSINEKNERYNKVRHKLAFNRWHFLHKGKELQLKNRKRDMLLSLHPYKND